MIQAGMIQAGSVIGIVGGGQLGRMLAMAAAQLGYRVHVYTPEADSPASEVAWKTTVAEYGDEPALNRFAESVDLVTFEFENVPHESLEALEKRTLVRPGASVLRICRNRVREKQFINACGIGTAPFARVTCAAELDAAMSAIGLPAILKTTELGYDGKGQATLKDGASAASAWASLNTPEGILEGFVDFAMEISVLVARGPDGRTVSYVPVQNIHSHHILDRTIAPAPIGADIARQAETIARTLAEKLELIGLLAVEMFVTRDGQVLVNELAPRPHNSGHWTMDACVTGQFEQQIRAVCGLPLGSSERLCDAEMKNLIGDDVRNAEKYLHESYIKLHLYGKKTIRSGRKMGHITWLKPAR